MHVLGKVHTHALTYDVIMLWKLCTDVNTSRPVARGATVAILGIAD
jgi:hypothetical protein